MLTKLFSDLDLYIKEIITHQKRIDGVNHKKGGRRITITSDVEVTGSGAGTYLYHLTSSARYSNKPFAIYKNPSEKSHTIQDDGSFPPREEISKLTEDIEKMISEASQPKKLLTSST